MKRERVINALRKTYPGKWVYIYPFWYHESGWYVWAESRLTPRFDGDDESSEIHYRRSDTLEDICCDWKYRSLT